MIAAKFPENEKLADSGLFWNSTTDCRRIYSLAIVQKTETTTTTTTTTKRSLFLVKQVEILGGLKKSDVGVVAKDLCIECIFKKKDSILSTYVQSSTPIPDCGYYTGIGTYRTENFSPAQKQPTVCFVHTM